MSVKVRCSVPNCQFETDEVSETLAIALLAITMRSLTRSQHPLAAQEPPRTSPAAPSWSAHG